MDKPQELEQLLSDDLASLSAYYREISALQGSGVLLVNYYPTGEVAQMSAKYLKPSSIPRLARQMGLPTLQVEFERHNQQSQMVVAAITAEIKGVVTVELPSKELQTAPAQTPSPQGQTKRSASSKRKSASKTTTLRKSSALSTPKQQDQDNQPQTETAEPETLVATDPTAEAETNAPTSAQSETISKPLFEVAQTKSKPTAQTQTTPKSKVKRSSSKTQVRRKSPAKSTRQQQEDTTFEPTVEPSPAATPPVESETTPEMSLEVETTRKPVTKRQSDSKTPTRGKSVSKTTTRRKTASPTRTRRKKSS